ncbi:MAG: hypothetical protein QM610_06050 [Chitinophagaceae bacterium]
MTKEYSFKYGNNKGGFYFLTGLFVCPFVGIFSTVFLSKYVSWIGWLGIPLMLAGMVYSFVLFSRKNSSTDTITMDDEGFTSKDYGRVLYAEIESIPPFNFMQAPPPSMRIRLKNGKKLMWALNGNAPGAKAQADAAIFATFRDQLLVQLKKLPTATANLAHTPTIQQPVEQPTVVQQLERQKKRDYKYVAIPVSLAFAILAFARTCGTDFIKQKRAKDMDRIREGFVMLAKDYQDSIELSRKSIKKYTKNLGSAYLCSNDPEASAQLLPDIPTDPLASMSRVKVLRLDREIDSKTLKSLIKTPENFSYQIVVNNAAAKAIVPLRKSIFAEDDSTLANVFFAVYNPDETLNSRKNSRDTTFRPINYSTSIQLPKQKTITKTVLKNMDFASIRSVMKQYRGTTFYMAAMEKDNIDAIQFAQIKALVMQDFQSYGIDTVGFRTQTWNE